MVNAELGRAGMWWSAIISGGHKHRSLLANAAERLHDEITADYKRLISTDAPEEVQKRRKAFLRKWRLRPPAVANSLEEAGDRVFTFTFTFPHCRTANGKAHEPPTPLTGYTRSSFGQNRAMPEYSRPCDGLARAPLTARESFAYQPLPYRRTAKRATHRADELLCASETEPPTARR
jgi:hypothetical protein